MLAQPGWPPGRTCITNSWSMAFIVIRGRFRCPRLSPLKGNRLTAFQSTGRTDADPVKPAGVCFPLREPRVTTELFIGMISGTSRDGADAALVRFQDQSARSSRSRLHPLPPGNRQCTAQTDHDRRRPAPEDMAALDKDLAAHFSRAALALLDKAGIGREAISAIGSHGQTVWHDPEGPKPESIQLGDPGSIARQTGIVTVGDFRQADVEAGGQGAPLAPLLHRALFCPAGGSRPATRVVLNLGGIANISVINTSGGVSGFDTGPANCLMDGWIRAHRNKPFDHDGHWAASGNICQTCWKECWLIRIFRKPHPKAPVWNISMHPGCGGTCKKTT